MQTLKLLTMLAQERLSPPRVARHAEPTATMDAESQVEAFHDQGATALLPIYHFNAMAASRLVPENGTLIDLGSGSGQYLAYLSACRPDMRIIGIELAQRMVDTGRKMLERRGLQSQVQLQVGDMTSFFDQANGQVDLVSSVFSLHHLPDDAALAACLQQVQRVRERTGCAVWLFDHVRPRHPGTSKAFPELFTPEAPAAFNQDSSNSLLASFSFQEMSAHLDAARLQGLVHLQSRWMNLYQVHFAEGVRHPLAGSAALWKTQAMSATTRKNLSGLQRLFPTLSTQA